jgi:DNA-binding MarR family transcriptional regulator
VQRIVNDLAAAGLVTLDANPAHKRSPFIRPTSTGQALDERIEARRLPWTEDLAASLDLSDIAAARRLVAALTARLAAAHPGD